MLSNIAHLYLSHRSMRVDCGHPGFLPLPPVCKCSRVILSVTPPNSVFCHLTTCFLPKASAPAVIKAEESGRQGMHALLSNKLHLITPLLRGLGCRCKHHTILGELIRSLVMNDFFLMTGVAGMQINSVTLGTWYLLL